MRLPMHSKIFLAATGTSLARAISVDGEWQVQHSLEGTRINCLVQDPLTPQRVYAGTQGRGILVSQDFGVTWQSTGLEGMPVKSLALSKHQPGLLYAGGKPVSLFISQDGGESWAELDGLRRSRKWWWFSPAEPPDWSPYVIALTISPSNPKVLMAGIELGGVLRSDDGGHTWTKHRRGALRDCHSLTFHPTNGDWVYQGGAGLRSGAAFSRDGGITWQQPKEGLGAKYGWKVVPDPERPEVWYLSASEHPNFLRGEFEPPAHVDGKANAHIYRSVGGAAWEKLSGGLPEPLDYMAYALVTDPQAPGHLYAGLSNGDVWHTTDYGDKWARLPFTLSGIHTAMIILNP
jgi:photosystem II stability/assembly factor-like uncharacterized protein